ncbi:MAG: 30S ribosome-binding factor RbfA [Clostridium sp.]|nr:30S ribosome-binding factor RbfA [Clostridium sp.]MCM1444623.1 30S ribosome-binding factor RbfA [Candidatus Amulumruptor caecigallinarius]
MSVKIDRINSTLVKEISYILQNEVKDKDIKFVTITDCKTASDLSVAKVYFTVFNMDRKKETIDALKNASGFIRHNLMDRVDIRYIPELTFIFDESIEYGKKIENIIDTIHEQD